VSEHRLRLTVTAAVAAQVPVASIAKVAGVTRQTVCNWSADYGQGGGLAVAAGAGLASLPAQRPEAPKGAPVLILGARRRGNIAYGLGCLGQNPLIVGSVGPDFAGYRRWLDEHGVDTSGVRTSPTQRMYRLLPEALVR
jgi:hypothetical protein